MVRLFHSLLSADFNRRFRTDPGPDPGPLGFCYEYGEGVPQDYPQSYAWYKLAAQEEKGALEKCSSLLKIMTPAQIEEGQRLSREYAEKFLK
ncbi:SEL1-like repeat protein [Pontiella sulfatireligans]|uniref:SEL1-like repeat protein n=1 Tax=Pontiella sulfatireligans TaxID=2750658 RepID=UPI0038B59345